MRYKVPVIVAIMMLLTIFPPSASAQEPVTVTIPSTTVTLTNRLLVTVPVAVVCDPLPDTPLLSSVFVTISQASSKGVINGGGGVTSNFGSSFLTCDGTTTNLVMVQATPLFSPFHGGPAIVSASAEYHTGVICGPGCGFFTNSEQGKSALIPVQLKGG